VRGVEVLRLPADQHGRVDVAALAQALGARGVRSMMVEGGAAVHGAFFDANLVDEVWAFVAPVIIGGAAAPGPVGGRGAETMAQALRIGKLQVESHGGDVLLRVRRASPSPVAEGE
jgi:diaminohydroxyphosphoribosylaminopyrimidine deaminase/5-amino-6-(5-phosphoribosylamino)uracil reductase